MKRTRGIYGMIGLFWLLGMAAPSSAWSYVYVVTAPVSGFLQLALTNYSGAIPYGAGSASFSFQRLTMLVDIDPKAFTMRQVGVISGTLNNPNMKIHSNENILGGVVPGDISIQQSIVGSGLSFDTGPLQLEWVSGSPQIANVLMPTLTAPFTVTGTYTLSTGGQTNQGTFSYTFTGFPVFPFDTVALSGFPQSITLSNFNNNGMNAPVVPPRSIVQFTARNQFVLNLGGGIDDGLDYMSLTGNPVTVTNGR